MNRIQNRRRLLLDHSSPVTLNSLDHRLLFEVLHKMPNFPLMRMRKTCRGMNKFVEEHKLRFSSRNLDPAIESKTKGNRYNFKLIFREKKGALEAQIDWNRNPILDADEEDGSKYGIPVVFPPSYNEKFFKIIPLDADFQKKISAFSFAGLEFEDIENVKTRNALYPSVQELLKDMSFSCRNVNFGNMPLNDVKKLIEHVDAKVYSIGYQKDEGSEDFLWHLARMENCSKFNVTISVFAGVQGGIYELVKDFRKFQIKSPTLQDFCQFINDMYRAGTNGKLKQINFNYSGRVAISITDPGPYILPRYSLLWAITEVPDKHHQSKTPCLIASLELPNCNKVAMIVEGDQGPRIEFIRKDATEELNFVLKNLDFKIFGDQKRSAYLASNDDRKLKIMKKHYMMEFDKKKRKL